VRLLALEGALARCSAALWRDGEVLAHAAIDGARGHAATLPALAQRVLLAAPGGFDAVAVGVGPGGFTGLRAAIALARGLALGAGVPCLGVTTGEALRAALGPGGDAGRAVWCAVDTKRGRIALERPGASPLLLDPAALPDPEGPVLLLGDAADAAASVLRGRGIDARVGGAGLPDAAAVAAVAAGALRGERPAREAAPLYLEAPALRGPAA